jgi:hypothetical protein
MFTAERGWAVESMDQSTFLENIPMVRIQKGQRTFESVTPSPCIVMVAKRSQNLFKYMVGGVGIAAAALCIATMISMRKGA